MSRYLYARGYAMDGNFHAEQMKMRVPGNDVPLMPGKMFMVNPTPYAEHLKVAKEVVVVSKGQCCGGNTLSARVIEIYM